VCVIVPAETGGQREPQFCFDSDHAIYLREKNSFHPKMGELKKTFNYKEQNKAPRKTINQ